MFSKHRLYAYALLYKTHTGAHARTHTHTYTYTCMYFLFYCSNAIIDHAKSLYLSVSEDEIVLRERDYSNIGSTQNHSTCYDSFNRIGPLEVNIDSH